MINIRNIYEKIFLLLMMVTLGISDVNGQTLKDYAKNYKEELAEKQRIEKEAYEKACNKGTLDALRYFVDKYPKSKYVKDVNSRI
jgi:outer membrane protein assembly factor BamD (BamD/ComL family)